MRGAGGAQSSAVNKVTMRFCTAGPAARCDRQARKPARKWALVLRRAWLAALLASAAGAWAQGLPSFAELEAAGARVGEIRIVPRNIFDTADPAEDRALFRLANALHVVTRPEVIRRALLFASGEPVSARVIEETERLLRANRYLYDVQIRPVAVRDGLVDIEVLTRDTWSIDPGVSFGRAGGANHSSLRLREYNLLGSGVSLGVTRSSTIDRRATEYGLSADRVFGTWGSVALAHARASDGRRHSASVVRPFNEIDARWAAGVSISDDDRVDSVHAAGQAQSHFRRRERRADMFAGWSAGLVEGWAQRYTVGLARREDGYAPEPGLLAPPALPDDQKLIVPYVRYELLEDRYERQFNRNLIGRPEFFPLGLNASAQVGLASRQAGSTRTALLYSGTVSRGFVPDPARRVLASAGVEGEWSEGRARRQQAGIASQYYQPQGSRRLFFASASVDVLLRPDPTVRLELGGDNGLRGYPLRYQAGTRRVLLTAEQRFYTDLFLWQVFRFGGAAFVDVGRAWGGTADAAASPWLGDVGVGLRIVSVRSAFSNVLHVDVATPLNAPPGLSKLQLLVKTKTSF